MRNIYICNTSSDYVSKINVDTFKEEKKIFLSAQEKKAVGSHDIFKYEGKFLVANSYSNTLSVIHKEKEEEVFFIGACCNGVVAEGGIAYIICGELNSIISFDLEKRKVIEQIPCGNLPHSIAFDREKKYILVCNMESSSLTVVNRYNKEDIKVIRIGEYPTKAIFTPDNQYILASESYLGMDKNGFISVIDTTTWNIIKRIPAGKYPVDLYCEGNACGVSNFGDGTVSIMNIEKWKEIKKLRIGGMPRGLLFYKQNLYVGDTLTNLIYKIDLFSESKSVIAVGKEPTAMTLD